MLEHILAVCLVSHWCRQRVAWWAVHRVALMGAAGVGDQNRGNVSGGGESEPGEYDWWGGGAGRGE
eukprot:3921579-Rhodomonas_salina.1